MFLRITIASYTDIKTTYRYLASWGYNSDQQLKSCEDNPRITVISLEDFKKMLSS